MKRRNKYFLITGLLSLLLVSSCKKIAKETSEEILEKGTKSISKEFTEESLEKISKKELKTITWGDFYKVIAKKMPGLAKSLDGLDKNVRVIFEKYLKKDFRFFKGLTSSNTILDECALYSKQAPKLMKDPNFMRMYVKANILRNEGRNCIINNLVAKEEGGFVKFYSKATNRLIAEYRDGIVNTFDKNILSQELIPNACYTIKGANGKKCSYFIDDLGRISSIEGKNMSPEEVASEIVNFTKKNDFGKTWDGALAKLKQSSSKDDINVKCQFSYSNDDELVPKYAHVETDIKGKKKVSSSYENIVKRTGNSFSAEENEATLRKYASKLGLSSDKSTKLLSEMNSDDGLARLIHEDPQLNIKRWLNTRNHVDKNAILRSPKGRMPQNARTYAGNVYYFNPHLNSGLKARLRYGNGYADLRGMNHLSYDDLVKLDKMYPEGVPFTKQGFPDFSYVAAKDKNGTPIKVNIGTLSGDSKKDINKAETIFQNQGNNWEAGFTWHHIENSTSLLRVPTVIHQLVDHSGGMSMSRVK
jgi:hypothetical protein